LSKEILRRLVSLEGELRVGGESYECFATPEILSFYKRAEALLDRYPDRAWQDWKDTRMRTLAHLRPVEQALRHNTNSTTVE
jgi:hypothetical protein